MRNGYREEGCRVQYVETGAGYTVEDSRCIYSRGTGYMQEDICWTYHRGTGYKVEDSRKIYTEEDSWRINAIGQLEVQQLRTASGSSVEDSWKIIR
jgi:hypothetical protein